MSLVDRCHNCDELVTRCRCEQSPLVRGANYVEAQRAERRSRAWKAGSDAYPVTDPGPEAVDKILRTLEDMALPPTDVARQSRRLRAHIEALREPELRTVIGQLAECTTSDETPGVAYDGLADEIIVLARRWTELDRARG